MGVYIAMFSVVAFIGLRGGTEMHNGKSFHELFESRHFFKRRSS